jgi:F-type H+-transporting ATPase subunit epsilon
MKIQLVTLDGVKFDEDAYAVVLPTIQGEITVLNGHMPLLTALKQGAMVIRRGKDDDDSKLEHYAIFGGVADIGRQQIRILSDEATHGDEINFAETEKAKAEAERQLANAKDKVEIERAQSLVDRHTVRLNVANLRRRQQSHRR